MAKVASRAVKLNLYKTVLQKARVATTGFPHMFRFQSECDPELWGTGDMYDLSEDENMMRSIFPKSVRKLDDNDFKSAKPALASKGHGSQSSSGSSLFKKYTYRRPISSHEEFERFREARSKAISDNFERAVFVKSHLNPVPIQTTPTPQSSVLCSHMTKTEYSYRRLAAVIRSAFKQNASLSELKSEEVSESEAVADAFAFCRQLDTQIAMNECTSVCEASGIRVIVTSRHISALDHWAAGGKSDGGKERKSFAFTYRVRVENHSRKWAQLLGRHWIIRDANGKLQTVDKFQPGVVGTQPMLEPGTVFVYGSGLHLNTSFGLMKGALQFNAPSGQLFEVPVAPFKLVANQSDRDNWQPRNF